MPNAPTRPTVHRHLAIVFAAMACLVAAPEHAAAQTDRLFPDRTLMPRLLAATNEAITAARLVVAPTTPSLFGTIVEGEAAFGAVLPVYRIAGTTPRDAVIVGVEGGVFGRFNLQTKERDLITSDWIFGLPVVMHRGPHWFRARYFHTRAHFGDEYLERFGVERVPSGRARGSRGPLSLWLRRKSFEKFHDGRIVDLQRLNRRVTALLDDRAERL